MTLTKFGWNYKKVVEWGWGKELYEDFFYNQSEPLRTINDSMMEKQASNTYNHKIFEIFPKQLVRCLAMAMQEIKAEDLINTFKIIKESF